MTTHATVTTYVYACLVKLGAIDDAGTCTFLAWPNFETGLDAAGISELAVTGDCHSFGTHDPHAVIVPLNSFPLNCRRYVCGH